jgi:acetyl-CoA synthetase
MRCGRAASSRRPGRDPAAAGAGVLTAHLAAYKLGAIAVPLAALFGVDALAYRLDDAAAKVLITDAAGLAKVGKIDEPLPELGLVISTDGAQGPAEDWERLLAQRARISHRSIPVPTIRR